MSKRNITAKSGKQLYLNSTFNKGMLFTSGETNEGYAKIIDNLDITPSGDSVSPRTPLKLTPSKDVKSRYTYPVVFQSIPDKQCYVNFPHTISELDYINDKLQENFSYEDALGYDQIQIISRDNNALNNVFEFDNESSNPYYNPDLELDVKFDNVANITKIIVTENGTEYPYDLHKIIVPTSSSITKISINDYSVQDADTITINGIKYRLANINAPEKNYKWYTYGYNFLKSFMRYLSTNYYKLIIREYGIDYYGRPIADIMVALNTDGTVCISINHIVVQLGLAKLDYINNEYKYLDVLEDCQNYAKSNNIRLWGSDNIDPYFKGIDKIIKIDESVDGYDNLVLEVVKIENKKSINYTTENIIDKVEFSYVDYNDSIVFVGRLIKVDSVNHSYNIIYKGIMYLVCSVTDDVAYFRITPPNNKFNGEKVNVVAASSDGYNLLNENVIDTNNVADTTRAIGCDGIIVIDPNNKQRIITQSILGNKVRFRAIMNESWYNHGFNIIEKDSNKYTKDFSLSVNYTITNQKYIPILKPEIGSDGVFRIRLFNNVSLQIFNFTSTFLMATITVGDNTYYIRVYTDGIYLEQKDSSTKIMLYSLTSSDKFDDVYILNPRANEYDLVNIAPTTATDLNIISNNSTHISNIIYNDIYYSREDTYYKRPSSEVSTHENNLSNNILYITPKLDKDNVYSQIQIQINSFILNYHKYDKDIKYSIPIINETIGSNIIYINNNYYTYDSPYTTTLTTSLGDIGVTATTTINEYTNGILSAEIKLNTEDIKLSINNNSKIQLKFKWSIANYGSDSFTDLTDYTTLYETNDFSNNTYNRISASNIDSYDYVINTNNDFIIKYSMLPVLHINDDIELSYSTQESYVIYPRFSVSSSVKYIDNEELTQNINIKLATRVGVFNRQVYLYGPYLRTNTIFFSKFEEPFYFSYPYYAIDISEKVLYCYEWNSNLVIFGSDNIWLLVTDGTVNNSTLSKIYDGLSITDVDRDLVKTFGSNLIFFNNNNGYIATSNKYYNDPTYINVYKLTENINNCLSNPIYIFRSLANIPVTVSLQKLSCRYKLYIDNQYINIICNMYTIDSESNYKRLVIIYRYNQLYKYWSTYSILNDDISIITAAYVSEANLNNQFIVYNENTQQIKLMYFDQSSYNKLDFDASPIITTIDTGFISIDQLNDKRFKDIIVDFNDINKYSDLKQTEHTVLYVYANFFIDGSPILLTDNNNSMDFEYDGDMPLAFSEGDYIFKWVNDITSNNIESPNEHEQPYGTTIKYKDGNIYSYGRNNLRIPVFGKGRLPSIVLKIKSDQNYEIVGYSIIYKEKNINRRR